MEHCSFCGASSDRARALVAGPQHVYICDACVELCRKTIDSANSPKSEVLAYDLPHPPEPASWISTILVRLLETKVRFAELPPPVGCENLPEHTKVQLASLQRVLHRLESDIGDAVFLATQCSKSGMPESKPRTAAQSRAARRRGHLLGPITDIFIASTDFIRFVSFDPGTLGLPTVMARGVTPDFLGHLSDAISAGSRNAVLGQMTIPAADELSPPWVIEIPGELCAHLAAVREGTSIELAEKLKCMLDTWSLDDLDWAIGEIMILATKAKSDRQSMWLWLDP